MANDLKKFESAVNNAVKIPLNQNQFDALVSLAYNIGTDAFSKSTLMKSATICPTEKNLNARGMMFLRMF